MKSDWPGFMAGLARFGDCVEWCAGPMRETLFFHPDDVAEIVASAGASGPLGRTLTDGFQQRAAIIGTNGLVMSEGIPWRHRRQILQPGMHRRRIAEYSAIMSRCAEDYCESMRTRTTLDVQVEMDRLTRRIMTGTLFGAEITESESDEIKRVMDRQLFLNTMEYVVGNWLPPAVPTPLRAALRSSSNRLRGLFEEVVRRRQRESAERRAGREIDLLDMLLDVRDDEGRPMQLHQLCDEMHNMFLAGYETSSNALGFALALIARHPDVQRRMHGEVVGAAGNQSLTFEHIARMPFVEAVAKEALRLFPPVFALPVHIARRPVTLHGYEFEPGRRIVICPYATQRDPRWFAEPDEFRPGRWLDNSTDEIPRFAWMPFGGGPRVCYGQQFAMAELILVVSVVVRRFHLALPDGAPALVKAKLSPTFMLRVTDCALTLAARDVEASARECTQQTSAQR